MFSRLSEWFKAEMAKRKSKSPKGSSKPPKKTAPPGRRSLILRDDPVVTDAPLPPVTTPSFQGVAEHVAATAFTKMQTDVSAIARGQAQANQNMHALNEALGEFRNKLVVPLNEELKHLRYNTGDAINQAVTELRVTTSLLIKVIRADLKARGHSDLEVNAFLEDNGAQQAPTGRELFFAKEKQDELERINANLVEQNQRLIARQSGHMQDKEFGDKACRCAVCQDLRGKIEAARGQSDESAQEIRDLRQRNLDLRAAADGHSLYADHWEHNPECGCVVCKEHRAGMAVADARSNGIGRHVNATVNGSFRHVGSP